jgi:mersacidin/lichenicidin family type 2 lantibiotic
MTHLDIIRAYKDGEYQLSRSDTERAQLPEHPAGIIRLLEPELASVHGGFGCSWNAHTGPYVRDPINYPSPSYEGGCGVDQSCPKEVPGGGICGVNMSCLGS